MARCILISLVVTICLCGSSTAQPKAPRPKQGGKPAKSTFPEFPPLRLGDVKKLPRIRQLQVERFKAAQEMTRILHAQYRQGLGRKGPPITGGTVWKAELLLLESRLDFAQSDTERIAILQVGVSMAKRIEMEAEAKSRVGGVAGFQFTDVPHTRYNRLKMEIRLECAKEKLKKPR